MGGVTRGRTAEPMSRNQNTWREPGGLFHLKLISDHGRFSFYEGQQGAANGQDSWGFFRDVQSFGRLDAGSRAGFTSSRPQPPWTLVFQLSFFLYDVRGLEKLGLVIKPDCSVISPLCC